MTPFTVRKDSIWAVPILHYTMELACQVKIAFDTIQPDCVAVELPQTLQEHAVRAASRLPDISVIQADDLYYMCEPCDGIFEGLRCALDQGKGAYCIDLDVRNYPQNNERLPDPYSILHIGLESYYEAYIRTLTTKQKDHLDHQRELHMARRLKELSLRYEKVLFIGGMSHVASVLKRVSQSYFEPLQHTKRSMVEEPGPGRLGDSSPCKDFETYLHGSPHSALKGRDCGLAQVQLVTLTEDSSRQVMAESGWMSLAYEAWRENTSSGLLDRQKILYNLYKTAAETYRQTTGNAFLSYHMRNTMKFARNYAWVHGRLMPDLFETLTAAKGCVDHNYAYETWFLATHYPHLKNIDNLPTLNLTVEEIWGRPKQIQFHLKQKQRKGLSFQKRAKDRQQMRMRPPSPFSICSYPPEDLVIENFGQFLKKKGQTLLGDEVGKVVPFTTSLEDGIDTRETIRHLYTRQIYVKVKGRPPGAVGSVVVIFDEDGPERALEYGEKYPWRTTWHGEHTQESDMAFYATHLGSNVVGPGISRCEYGGFLMSYPPRRMMDVWRDPDYFECRTKAEVLLMAAIDYAVKPLVVYVSEKAPSSRIKNFAARFGRKIVYFPIGQLSPVMLNKIRAFHVLDGHDKREIADEYIF